MGNQNNDRLVLQTKAFVADLLAGVHTEDSIQEMIRYIMKEIGVFTHADRVCIFESGSRKNCVERVYHWESENTDFDDDRMRFLQRDKMEGWMRALNQQKLVVVKNRDSIRETMPKEYEIMANLELDSLMLIPIYVQDCLIACMSLGNPDFSSFALPEQTRLFLGKQIGMLYRRERLNHKYLLFMEGIRSSNLSEFIVDVKTGRYEAFRITGVLSNLIPEEGDWQWLRQFYASIIKPEYKEDILRRTEREYLESFLCTEKSTYTIDIERDVNGVNNWFRLEFSAVSLDEKGHLERFVLLVKDITQMKQEEEEHQQMIKALSSTYKASFMINLCNATSQPIKLSNVAQQFMSDETTPHEKVLEIYCTQMVDKEYVDSVREFMDLRTLEQRFGDTNMLTCEYQGKQTGWGRIILTPAKRKSDGSLEKVVFAVQDITEQKRTEEWMQYKIEHDELTGTLNRAAFNRVTKLLEDTKNEFGFVLMDIDRFKVINDTYGHDVGDTVLQHLVFVLNEKMRYSDKVFRLGGDEFAIIMNRLTLDQADRVKSIVESVNETTTQGAGGMPAFSVSAGVAFSVTGYDETIYHNADVALYRTKQTTRRGCTVFEEMEEMRN